MIQLIILWFLINRSIAQDCQQVGCPIGACCSKWGYCGYTPLHCATDINHSNTTYDGTCRSQASCQAGFCCSKWGYCGDTPLHCSTAGQMNNTNGATCEPACAPGFCCSRWGFCGDSPLHCEGNQANQTLNPICDPPCRAGFCCSRWGFCGDSPLHCEGNQANQTLNPICDPPCRPGFCCSKWGFCGDSSLHCSDNPNPTTPPVDTGRCSSGSGCPPGQCCSRWGYCGSTPEFCNTNPPAVHNETTMTRQRFDCIFDQLSPSLRDKRWQGYQDALDLIDFQPENQDELMMFFAHVSHETDGLKTYEEYCGHAGTCADDYQDSWCSPVEAQSGKQYYGRGWFQLSWPCNYNAAGQALGIDLLGNPEKVAESDALAAATAMWFWKENNMGASARDGNFGATTEKINKIECGPTPQQDNRIKRYQKVRSCFGLDSATSNLRC